MTGSTETERLAPSDSLMWRIEADPVLRSPVLVVGLLDRAPSRARLRAAVERAIREIPGLRRKLVPPAAGVGAPTWREVERVSLDHHLRRLRAPAGDLDGVLGLLAPDANAPFDPERPLWSLTVIDGMDGGGAAFALRFHHAITDGMGGLRLAHHLFDRTRRPPVAVREPGPPPGHTGDTGHTASPGRPMTARLLHDAGVAARLAAGSARDPGAAVAGSARLARSLWRLLAPVPPVGSPLLAGRGIDRTLHAFTVPLPELREAAAATGGTVNDVLLSAVGGAFRAYHRHHDVPLTTLRVSMPVDRRRDDDPDGGNHFTPTRFVLPIDEPDPAVRARIAGSIVRSLRAEPALGATDVVAAGLDLLPGPAVTRVFGRLLRDIDVNVVDLRGLREPAFLARARVERLWAFAPAVGSACSITLLSHGDTGCLAVTCDRAAVSEPGLLTACLEAAFDEVLACARDRVPAGRSA